MLAAALTISGCSALGGSSTSDASGSGDLEKSSISVATVVTVDLAPFWIALDNGYFKAEGLDVRELINPDTKTALTKTISGEADIGLGTYPAFFTAMAQGVGDLRFVADGTSANPLTNEIVTVPGSGVMNVRDLAGKRIAVSSVTQASGILTKNVMRDNGVDYSTVQWQQMPLPNMAAALKDKQVDAAYLPQPFLTQASMTAQAFPVIDAASGSARDIPITGYAAQGEWIGKYPHTMAAFQRAMDKATRDANNFPDKVQTIVVKHAKVEENVAEIMTQPAYQSKLDARRLQRVADLLQSLGVVNTRVDAATKIAPQLPNG